LEKRGKSGTDCEVPEKQKLAANARECSQTCTQTFSGAEGKGTKGYRRTSKKSNGAWEFCRE